jgi:hypothetical protein
VIPTGWFRLEAVNYCRALEMQLQDAINFEKQTILAAQINENNKRFEQFISGSLPAPLRHRLFAGLLLPALQKAARSFAVGQVTAHEAALACALERYRLANGKLPESLDALVPQFIAKLPHDTLTGGPLKYERLSDTEFVLSSVGWPDDETSGVGRPRSSAKRVEWVWRSAP